MRAREAIREVSPSTKVGITLALQDYQPGPGAEEAARERWAETFDDFLSATEDDDFLGVQNYTRVRVGADRALADGVDVRGYFYWLALDNYEWMFGYRPKFGLIAVDRATQRRTVKDSARFLGAIAKRNSLS